MTAVFYTARQMVKAAIEKEKKRKKFYATVTELSRNADMKALFHFLTEEEEAHVVAFTKIYDSLPEETLTEEYQKSAGAYLDSIIEDRLYSKISSREFVQKAIDTWNVFSLAIRFEKDAIQFFIEFLPHLSDSDRKTVNDLIRQEKGHIRRLVQVMKQVEQL